MPRDDAYLLDILIAARRVLKFTAGFSREQFEKNELVQNAAVYPMEVMGEAAGRISEEFRDAHPEIPWHKMIGMRNRLSMNMFA